MGRRLDEAWHRVYYLNTITKARQWDAPVAAAALAAPILAGSAVQLKDPDGIEAKIDPKTGRTFYVDHFLKKTSWDAPRKIPVGWERSFDSRTQKIYYIDHVHKKTQYAHPLD